MLPIFENAAVVDAIYLDDMAYIANFIKTHPDYNYDYCLFTAAEYGKKELVELFIELNAELDYVENYSKLTPLAVAALNKHTDIVKLLLQKGADPYLVPHLHRELEQAGYQELTKLIPSYHSQRWLTSRLHTIYPNFDESGVCDGATWLTIIESLIDGLTENLFQLNKRLSAIKSIPLRKFAATLKAAQEKQSSLAKQVKPFGPVLSTALFGDLDDKTEEQLTIALDLDYIALFQTITEIPNFDQDAFSLFSTKLKLLQLLSPISLDAKGGISLIDSFSGIYSPTELIDFFDSLEETRKECHFKAPIAIRISSGNVKKTGHSIALIYKPNPNGWYLTDINGTQKDYLTYCPDGKKFSQQIKEVLSFGKNRQTDMPLVFSTSLFVTADRHDEARDFIHHWRNTNRFIKLHEVTPAKATLLDKRNITWLDAAVRYESHPEVIIQLQKGKGSFLIRNKHSILYPTTVVTVIEVGCAALLLCGNLPLLTVAAIAIAIIMSSFAMLCLIAKLNEYTERRSSKKLHTIIQQNETSTPLPKPQKKLLFPFWDQKQSNQRSLAVTKHLLPQLK